jgi:uncharacterized membrane protein YqaE (UPF0057 family)
MLTGPLASIVLAIIIPYMVFGNTKGFGADTLGGIIASALAASIWTAYLSKSKRVRNTYSNYSINFNKTVAVKWTCLCGRKNNDNTCLNCGRAADAKY